jgi:hypothetical protein
MESWRWGFGMKPEGVWGRGAWWWECEGGSGLGGLGVSEVVQEEDEGSWMAEAYLLGLGCSIR